MRPVLPLDRWVRVAAWLGSFSTSLLLPRAEAAPPSSGTVAVKSASARDATRLVVPFERYALPNGLEVILHRDESLPLVAVNLWYHVGPAHEPPERSGFAHLFEHLMFEGSKHAGHQFDYLLEAAGGTNMNGTTSWDRTNYYETVPSQHLELALWLEADRMGFMIDTLTQERLDVQRGVVKNERRQSYENSPYGPSWLTVYETLFEPTHPYHGAVIGSMQDLDRASFEDVRAFFAQYYAPGNATLTLAGNFDPSTTKRLIDKHFGTLPGKPGRAARHQASQPAPSTAPVRRIVTEPVELAQVIFAWRLPAAYGPDHPALSLLSGILASGKASRLYSALVRSGLASSVSAELDANELASIFTIDATVQSGKSIEQVEAALENCLAQLLTDGVTDQELERAKTAQYLSYASELQRLNAGGGETGRAGFLQHFNHYLGDPGGLSGFMGQMESVSSQQLLDVAARSLRTQSRLTVITEPAGSEGGAP